MSQCARVVVLDGPNGSFSVSESRCPSRVRASFYRAPASGVCATDTHIYKGEVPGIPYPVVMGHEFVGTIARLGSGVTHDTEGKPVREGDRVVPMPATPCGVCYECVVQPGPVVNCDSYDVIGFSDKNLTRWPGGGPR